MDVSGGWIAFLRRRGDAIGAGLIASAALALLVATLDDPGMAWDEGFVVERVERLQEWFGRAGGDPSAFGRAWSPFLSMLEPRSTYLRLAGPTAGSPWSRESLRFYWQFSREEPNGHPPFYALLSLAGWAVSHHFLPPLAAYRFGPAALFAATLGVIYRVMARRYGRPAGVMAALGLLTMPRAFAHAHLATTDAPTLSLWFLAVAAFAKAVITRPGEARGRTWPWVVAFGLAWGCAAATKLTGWFVPFPLVAWAVLYRDRRASLVLILAALIAAVVVYAMNPTWWAEPIAGLGAFFRSNLTRDQLRPIPTVFFGRLYLFALPWYNTLVLTAIVVPPLTLVLSLIGIIDLLINRLRDRTGTLMLLCWAFFMVLRALPGAPGHDGERQFLAAFAFLAALSGIGLAAVGSWLGRRMAPHIARGLTFVLLLLTLSASSWSTWRYHPLQLSYYNAMIGGLSGASRAGLEPTFYWDAVTPDVRVWLDAHTDPGRAVAFVFPAVSFEYLHRWGLLRPSPLARLEHAPQWFVVMNRPGHLRYPSKNLGGYLLDHVRPAYVKTLDVAPDVPLIAIYSGEDASTANLLLNRTPEIHARP